MDTDTPTDDVPSGFMPRRADGLVYGWAALGWVDEATFFDHRWDTSRTRDEYERERAPAWAGVTPGR
jgi:hypothetical protein